MLIKVGYEISFLSPQPTPMVLMLYLHPTRASTTLKADNLLITPTTPVLQHYDMFGNLCGRIVAPTGSILFHDEAVVDDCGLPDLQAPDAAQTEVQDLPPDVLPYLLASRYCEVDSELKDIAWKLFGETAPGWTRVQAICDFVHNHIKFDYMQARSTRTALDAYREQVGVCRDYMHLAVTFCRACNIPARYCTGYLGDIGVPAVASPMDFSAWFEAYLDGEWYAFDARNNTPRIGRVLMARGRDAADVALTTSFGPNELQSFRVWAKEVG
ncbi:transglutaminase-like domain-containing protein [Lignipirellula cremea]|uniref:Transglutaminase-like superfamily protein n=1 Tax=Lignipirellula cremea TaxID=2528010 RepID=A0A518DN74_9BACT|nr:transglutaminase family protein [Lignipirellula cremea]QDU93289.1 Transglutaminase-like superfamily protein [Lignipirellula cremea]